MKLRDLPEEERCQEIFSVVFKTIAKSRQFEFLNSDFWLCTFLLEGEFMDSNVVHLGRSFYTNKEFNVGPCSSLFGLLRICSEIKSRDLKREMRNDAK